MASPLPEIAAPLTIPASWAYRGLIQLRNRRYDFGSHVQRVDAPVISVGNLTTGGVGKTPMVRWIAELLMEHAHSPGIVMRGYGATHHRKADEHLEYEAALPQVPVAASPNRVAACRALLAEQPQLDCLILDDGFQHRRVHRDLDLVLIDATRDTLNDRILPAGHLREPVSSLTRADGVIITRAETVDDALAAAVEAVHGQPPVAWTRHVWTGLKLLRANSVEEQDVSWLGGKRILTMLGVGNPRSIHVQLEQLGALCAVDVPARDHERFSPAKLAMARRLCQGLDATVVTAKDWARMQDLLDLHDWPTPIVVPHLALDVVHGHDALREMVLDALTRH